jgi:hypothetical protein
MSSPSSAYTWERVFGLCAGGALRGAALADLLGYNIYLAALLVALLWLWALLRHNGRVHAPT